MESQVIESYTIKGTGSYVKLILTGGTTRFVKNGFPEHNLHIEVINQAGSVRCFVLEEMDKAFDHYYKCCERFRKAVAREKK